MTTIETRRLLLRPFATGDVDAYDAVRRKPSVARFLPSFRGADAAEIRARTVQTIADIRAHWAQHGYGPWAAIEKASGRFLGHCGLRFLPEHEATEILYAFDDTVWGRGLATEGAAAARDYAFDTLRLAHVIALVLPENRGSIRVIEKLGLVPDGHSSFLGNKVLRFRLDRTPQV